jgi:hypothetical protein
MGKAFGNCTYCRRELASPRSRFATAFTKDHVMPKAVGGTRKVPCCLHCNRLKGDMHPQVWRWFTTNYPKWWKEFRTNREVVEVCYPVWGAMCRCSATGRAMQSEFERREAIMPRTGT